MPRRVVLSRRVRNWLDLENEYLASHGPAAVRHLREIIDRAQRLLGDFPQGGRRGQTPGTRRLVVAPYVLTYREIGRGVVIVDIRHSRQAERPIPDEA